MVAQLIQQAEILLETNRPAEAEKKIRQAVFQNPENPDALTVLAQCLLQQDKHAEALQPAQRAVSLRADDPHGLFVLGYAQMYNNQLEQARETVRGALKLAPDAAGLYQLMAQLELVEERWELALHNVEKGLERDPENETLANLRVMTLVKLNRTAEAADTVGSTLHKNPENTFSHASKGWVAVEKGDYAAAEKSFLEALRLDPTNAYATDGLKEAIKAKNLLYRVILRYFLWMGKLTSGNKWLVIIGAYVGFRIVRATAKNYPDLQIFLMPLIVLYILFVFSSWIAGPVSNLVLRLHPLGKHALTDDEKQGSTLVGLCLGMGILSLVAGVLTAMVVPIAAGIVLLVLTIPIGGMYSTTPNRSARKTLAWYAGLLAAAGLVLPAIGHVLDLEQLVLVGFVIFGIGIFAYGWVANYLIMRDARQF